MKTKDEKSDILEDPTMFMKTKQLINYSCQCARGSGRNLCDQWEDLSVSHLLLLDAGVSATGGAKLSPEGAG